MRCQRQQALLNAAPRACRELLEKVDGAQDRYNAVYTLWGMLHEWERLHANWIATPVTDLKVTFCRLFF